MERPALEGDLGHDRPREEEARLRGVQAHEARRLLGLRARHRERQAVAELERQQEERGAAAARLDHEAATLDAQDARVAWSKRARHRERRLHDGLAPEVEARRLE